MRMVLTAIFTLAGNLALVAAANIGRRAVSMPAHVSWAAVAGSDQLIPLQMVLKMKNNDIEGHLRKHADPASSCYSSWMTRDEVMDTFGPSQASVGAVAEWLELKGIRDFEVGRWAVNFRTTIQMADMLFDADFAWYEVRGMRKLRTLHYTLPDELGEHVDLVTPTTYFGPPSVPEPEVLMRSLLARDGRSGRRPPRPLRRGQDGPENATNLTCRYEITPFCLDQLYDYSWYTPPANTSSRVGFSSFLNISAHIDSYRRFLELFDITARSFESRTVNGGVSNQSELASSGEADLDVQMLSAVAPGLPVTEFIVGGVPPFVQNLDMPSAENNTNEPYLDWYQYLMARENDEIPQVLSNSYGEPEDTVPFEYAKRVCDLIGLMGLRGVTVLESSGDTGVGSGCLSVDNRTAQFDIQFPASCPYITSVGGTQSFGPEMAWSGGGGGFSKYFPRAWYQDAAVEHYLNRGISNATRAYYEEYTNFGGRGVPDVAVHSFDPPIVIWSKGRTWSGGTSASAPIVAGLFGLLNAMRLAAGRPTMGFINPWLYRLDGRGFTDVMAGSAVGCNGQNTQLDRAVPGAAIIPWASWNGTRGWDPVTGLGVPNLRFLAEVEVYASGMGQTCVA